MVGCSCGRSTCPQHITSRKPTSQFHDMRTYRKIPIHIHTYTYIYIYITCSMSVYVYVYIYIYIYNIDSVVKSGFVSIVLVAADRYSRRLWRHPHPKTSKQMPSVYSSPFEPNPNPRPGALNPKPQTFCTSIGGIKRSRICYGSVLGVSRCSIGLKALVSRALGCSFSPAVAPAPRSSQAEVGCSPRARTALGHCIRLGWPLKPSEQYSWLGQLRCRCRSEYDPPKSWPQRRRQLRRHSVGKQPCMH